ncbi:MAG: hypothetical protein K2X39_07275, partial [Silvanigrellaceae bacterium]|nr:hypothetical protein [Silvanigrellaceae bacterium]
MSANRCQEILHSLLEYSLKPEFEGEMKIARELYTIATGQVNDDDPFYEQRMSSLQEFFLFDYRLHSFFSGATIFETFLYHCQAASSLERLNDFEQMRSYKHSLFS